MRLSDKYKFVFISNPRCGSTSMRRLLDPYSDIQSIKFPKTDWKNHHAPASRVAAGMRRMGRDPDEYLFITTIRNPWDRVYSIYKFGRINSASVWHSAAVSAASLDEFVLNVATDERLRLYPLSTVMAGVGAKIPNEIIRLEDITAKMPPLIEALTGEAQKIPHINGVKGGAYRDAYNDEYVIARVGEIFASDIEAGGYCY